jgi:AcrR family transcriptional regulator
MAEIIAESGTSPGMLYGHFNNKAVLIQSVGARLLERRAGEFEAVLASGAVLSLGRDPRQVRSVAPPRGHPRAAPRSPRPATLSTGTTPRANP